ncbi:unnamed protein product [Orchesella dallaii]|uniref:Epidermal growth factor-like domain-containing protein n=1 Tax=Orchesella dallaii TaxID=48710 RepID=A0ABP1QR66_9HEXA
MENPMTRHLYKSGNPSGEWRPFCIIKPKMFSCEKALGGKYCQCDNTACPFEENTDIGLCNEAAGQGRCVCRRCKCHKGFNGVRCQCPLSNHTCRDSMSSDMICSGKGSCECGKCSCDLGYTGYFCEIEHARLVSVNKLLNYNLYIQGSLD